MNSQHENAKSQQDSQPARWAARTIPLPSGHHLCGRVAYAPPPLSIPVESDLEARVVHFLLDQPDLVAVHAQPFTLSYLDRDGQAHEYTPDFLVVYDRLTRSLLRLGFARWTVLEVKPAVFATSCAGAISTQLDAVRRVLGLAAICFTDAYLPAGRA